MPLRARFVDTAGGIAEDRPPPFVLWALVLQTDDVTQHADLVLEPTHNTNGELLLLTTETVSRANHFGTAKSLGIPLVTLQTGLEVSVALSLKEIVILALQRQVVALVVATIVADQFDHLGDRVLVLMDQLPVFLVFVLVVFNTAFLLCELALEISDASS